MKAYEEEFVDDADDEGAIDLALLVHLLLHLGELGGRERLRRLPAERNE